MFLGKIAVVSLNPFLWLFSSFSPKTALQSFGVQYLRETVLRMRGHGNGVLYKELTGDQQTHCNAVSNMPNITNYTRRRIIALQKGLKPGAIFKKIEEFKNIFLRVFQLSPESLRSLYVPAPSITFLNQVDLRR